MVFRDQTLLLGNGCNFLLLNKSCAHPDQLPHDLPREMSLTDRSRVLVGLRSTAESALDGSADSGWYVKEFSWSLIGQLMTKLLLVVCMQDLKIYSLPTRIIGC